MADAAAKPVVETPAEEKDEFAEAFAELAAAEPAPNATSEAAVDKKAAAAEPAKAAETPEVKSEETPEAKAAAETPEAKAAAAKAAAETPEAKAAAAKAAAETPEAKAAAAKAAVETPEAKAAAAKAAEPAKDEDLLERFAKIVKDQGDKEPAKTELPAPAELFSAEEKQMLAAYEKDWPDVARAELVRRRAEYQQLTGYIFAEFAKEMKPILDMVGSLASRTHLADLRERAPDYDTIRDQIEDWAGKQPAYLQAAYKHVIDEGTAEEVGDLITRFRAETGIKSPVAKTPVPPKTDTELPPATKQAAAALAPVSSKRSAVAGQTLDPNDFESAFAAFAKTV